MLLHAYMVSTGDLWFWKFALTGMAKIALTLAATSATRPVHALCQCHNKGFFPISFMNDSAEVHQQSHPAITT